MAPEIADESLIVGAAALEAEAPRVTEGSRPRQVLLVAAAVRAGSAAVVVRPEVPRAVRAGGVSGAARDPQRLEVAAGRRSQASHMKALQIELFRRAALALRYGTSDLKRWSGI